ncbi:MAG: hypothetical protein ABIG84_01665 [archaeon]
MDLNINRRNFIIAGAAVTAAVIAGINAAGDVACSVIDNTIMSEVPLSLDPYDFIIKTEEGYDVSLLLHSTYKNGWYSKGPGTSFTESVIEYDSILRKLFGDYQVNAGIISDGRKEKILFLSDKVFASRYSAVDSYASSKGPVPKVRDSDLEIEAYTDALRSPVDFKSLEGGFKQVRDCPGLYYLLMDIAPQKNALFSTPDNIYNWYLKPKVHADDPDALSGLPEMATEQVHTASPVTKVDVGYTPQPVPRPVPTAPVTA